MSAMEGSCPWERLQVTLRVRLECARCRLFGAVCQGESTAGGPSHIVVGGLATCRRKFYLMVTPQYRHADGSVVKASEVQRFQPQLTVQLADQSGLPISCSAEAPLLVISRGRVTQTPELTWPLLTEPLHLQLKTPLLSSSLGGDGHMRVRCVLAFKGPGAPPSVISLSPPFLSMSRIPKRLSGLRSAGGAGGNRAAVAGPSISNAAAPNSSVQHERSFVQSAAETMEHASVPTRRGLAPCFDGERGVGEEQGSNGAVKAEPRVGSGGRIKDDEGGVGLLMHLRRRALRDQLAAESRAEGGGRLWHFCRGAGEDHWRKCLHSRTGSTI